jgi:hypothetical protein
MKQFSGHQPGSSFFKTCNKNEHAGAKQHGEKPTHTAFKNSGPEYIPEKIIKIALWLNGKIIYSSIG